MAHTWRMVFLERVPGNYLSSGKFKPTSKLARVKKIPPSRTGTSRIRFWPDLNLFDADARVEYDKVRDHVARVCFLVPGLHVQARRSNVIQVKSLRSSWPPEAWPTTSSICRSVKSVTDVLTIQNEADLRGEGARRQQDDHRHPTLFGHGGRPMGQGLRHDHRELRQHDPNTRTAEPMSPDSSGPFRRWPTTSSSPIPES